MQSADRIVVDGVEILLASPVREVPPWVGRRDLVLQLEAAWSRIGPEDLPLHPRLLGKPGVGKTTLGCAVARRMGLEVYIAQATMDTRPEDLLVSPVLAPSGQIHYRASPLVSAMVRGGALVLDEGNRMSEKSWASLAPLLDHRRYVESLVAGVRIEAHPEFRFVTTMNEDASTYEVPEYIHSRLMPQIYLDFPEEDEEREILETHAPYAERQVVDYVMSFLRRAHEADLRYTARDGINMVRYAMKILHQERDGGIAGGADAEGAARRAVRIVLDEDELEALPPADPAE